MAGGLEISSDRSKLDISFIHGFISNSYWGKGRSLALMQTCIEHSLNFGVYALNRQQIGYARVVTDYAQFAYIMDLFIDEAHRGKGYSKVLIKHILEQQKLKSVCVWRLSTSDAHALYRKFGFTELRSPGNMMEKMTIPSVG